ncbi:MAG: adenylyltransferase/cytidyltransferase family protein [Saprospiraceae bacterium]|nr:adenylyltransferase/cytidyltransferase family protein [Saprospiraceae bacterium]
MKKVFVSGCFDMLHSGHVAFLESAAQYGDLYVGIGSDQTILELKNRNTIFKENERKYIIENLKFVKKCFINSGNSKLDFLKELDELNPDIFVVNQDGHSLDKANLCEEKNIQYIVLERIPKENLAARSTTDLLKISGIPYRIDLAGGWLDQPYVSKHCPGPVLTISILPTHEFNLRSGMSSSTRNKAKEIWNNNLPNDNPEQLAKLLFCFDNPPGTTEVSGSQDALGIVMPGLNYLYYDKNYWPTNIINIRNQSILDWLEDKIQLIPLSPRESNYNVLENTDITIEKAKNLSEAAERCWKSILEKDVKNFGFYLKKSFEAQISMFPNMVDEHIMEKINNLSTDVLGYKISGAGGGGYLIVISDSYIENAIKIKIRN